MIRTFVCIELSECIKDELASVIQQIKHVHSVKWVNPASIHLTLKFLGDVAEDQLPDIIAAVQKATTLFDPFSIQLAEYGAFPHFKRPRVYWVGLNSPGKTLFSLQSEIDKELEQVGFSKEQRRFSPHLTLGRVKSNQNDRELDLYFQQQQPLSSSMDVHKIVVMQSELTPAGARYTPLGKTKLGHSE